MSEYKLDIPWTLIEPDTPMGADMVDVSGVSRKWLNVPYGSETEQILDIYLPEEGVGPFPTYIFIHGGAFFAGDKQDVQFLLGIEGINRGYAVASVEYRKAPNTKAPDALYDIKTAIRFLRKNAGKYNLDPEKFALGGDSAGAYYAVFAAATENIRAFDGKNPLYPEISSNVQAVIAQCGLYDLLVLAPTPEEEAAAMSSPNPPIIPPNLMTMYVGANPHLISGITELLNPINYITEAYPPTLVQVGKDDAVVPYTESESLVKAIEAKGGKVRYELHEGWNHCALNHILTPDWFMSENYDRVFAFLDEVL